MDNFSLRPAIVGPGDDVRLFATISGDTSGEVQVLLDGNPLGDPLPLTSAGRLAVTVTVPEGLSSGTHMIQLATTADPPQILGTVDIQVVLTAGVLEETGSSGLGLSTMGIYWALAGAVILGLVLLLMWRRDRFSGITFWLRRTRNRARIRLRNLRRRLTG